MRWLPLIGVGVLAGCGSLPWQTGDVPQVLDEDDCDDPVVWYLDNDDDGFGTPDETQSSCGDLGGWSTIGGDCDDNDGGTFPNAIEVCDGVDRDCDGLVDNDAVDAQVWYVDEDGDGFGVGETGEVSCDALPGRHTRTGDCNDADDTIFPGAPDLACDGIDQDCDGSAADGPVQTGGRTWPTLQAALDARTEDYAIVCAAGEHPVSLVQDGGTVRISGWAEGEVVLVPAARGRVLDVTNADSVGLRNVVLSGGRAEGDGGAARLDAERIDLDDVVLLDNRATGDGGALWVSTHGDEPRLSLRVSMAEGNVAGGNGGAVAIEAAGAGADVRLTTSGNTAGGDGGALFVHADGALALGLTATGDHADGDGGAFAIVGDEIDVDADIVVTGASAGGSGGGVSAVATGAVSFVVDATVLDSRAELDGGGLSLVGDAVNLWSSVVGVDGCQAGRDGGGLAAVAGAGGFDLRAGVVNSVASGRGGGVFATVAAGDSTLWGERLEGNTATTGGAVYVAGQESTAAKARLKLSLTHLLDNQADEGAAVLVTRAGASAELLTISMQQVLRNLGGAAVVVEGATGGKLRTTDLDGNTGGGVRTPDSLEVSCTGDLGATADNNGPFDVRWGDVVVDGTSEASMAIRCQPGDGCTTTE